MRKRRKYTLLKNFETSVITFEKLTVSFFFLPAPVYSQQNETKMKKIIIIFQFNNVHLKSYRVLKQLMCRGTIIRYCEIKHRQNQKKKKSTQGQFASIYDRILYVLFEFFYGKKNRSYSEPLRRYVYYAIDKLYRPKFGGDVRGLKSFTLQFLQRSKTMIYATCSNNDCRRIY